MSFLLTIRWPAEIPISLGKDECLAISPYPDGKFLFYALLIFCGIYIQYPTCVFHSTRLCGDINKYLRSHQDDQIEVYGTI